MADVTEIEQRQNLKKQRAELARQILDNPVYNEAMMLIRAAHVESLSNIKPSDIAALQEATRTLQNLNRLEKTLKRVYEGGKVVEKKRLFSKP